MLCVCVHLCVCICVCVHCLAVCVCVSIVKPPNRGHIRTFFITIKLHHYKFICIYTLILAVYVTIPCMYIDAGQKDLSGHDPHMIAGCLKKETLRELSEPILTYSLYKEWMQAAVLGK